MSLYVLVIFSSHHSPYFFFFEIANKCKTKSIGVRITFVDAFTFKFFQGIYKDLEKKFHVSSSHQGQTFTLVASTIETLNDALRYDFAKLNLV